MYTDRYRPAVIPALLGFDVGLLVQTGADGDKAPNVAMEFTLEIVECPDRNLVGTIASHVREVAAQPRTQVTVLIPVRRYLKPWHRVLHDATSRALIRRLGRIPNAHVTIVPFALKARPVLRAVDTPS